MLRIHKKLLTLSMLFSIFVPVFAHGKSDIEEVEVSNLNSWQEEIDLESKKAGKYNIMITAKDLGGNVSVEGPHNIWVDPNSDLPVCGITNPYPEMRVVGNLNIVGTCVDDDGVSKVELILDEGTEIEKRVTAEGKEFWSYYLDTNDLEEGPHTIKVLGYDINEIPVESKPVVLTWQLDRKQPVTEIQDKSMGVLVSGNVKFDGIVSDGNGIKELFYSTDNGENFVPVKINSNKTGDICSFSINIDTKKYADGPAVLWFKAIDKATSVGYYSFLYFIDNTKPDVQIVSPAADQTMDGIFTVAGFAKDTIGVTELSWSFGTETGVFDLIPGNPYWAVTLDTRNIKEKSQKFVIHAVDRAGNIVDVPRNILLNQENDKPVVKITEPAEGQVFTDDGRLFVRGIASDDDALKAVKIQFDGNEPVLQETKGVFYLDLCAASDLSAGTHKVTVTGIDVNDVEGNPFVINFVSKGIAPVFETPKVSSGKDSVDFVNGMEIHPESGSVFSVNIASGIGITKVVSQIFLNDECFSENQVDLKNLTSYTNSLPINFDSPKGVVKYVVTATDAIGRETKYNALLYITNTSVVKNDDPVVVFDDSTVSEDGTIIPNFEFLPSGYLLGADAQSVEIVPPSAFVAAQLQGNQIKLNIDQNEIGISNDFVVRVKTTKGKIAESRTLRIKNDREIPQIDIEDYSENMALDGREGQITIKGRATCRTKLESVQYRIIPVLISIDKGVISKVLPPEIPEGFDSVSLMPNGNFTIDVDTSYFENGMYVLEIIANSEAGNKTAKAVAISIIPEIEEQNGKMPAPKAPVITWVDGFDVYALGIYQGELDRSFQTFERAQMSEGKNDCTFEVTILETEKLLQGKYSAQKQPTLSAAIALVNGEEYLSGIPVELGYMAKTGSTVTVYIDSSVPVSSVSYEFSGDEIPGGNVTQKGAAKITKPSVDQPLRWSAEIPVLNLPSRVNHLQVTVKAGSLEQTLKGDIIVVRPNDQSIVNDSEEIFEMPQANLAYDEIQNSYVFDSQSEYYYYANVKGPVYATINGKAATGLSLQTNGNLVTLKGEKDGIYQDVTVTFTDRFGDSYTSKPVNIIVNNTQADVVLVAPVLHDWLNNSLSLSGTAAHSLGIRSVEYSVDYGENWQKFELPSGKAGNLGVTYKNTIDISSIEDGLIPIDIRATDISGKSVYFRTAGYKDVTPPEASVVVPLDIDVVNGENLIVFDVKDNAFLASADYVTPPVNGKSENVEIPLQPLISMYIGTKEAPIDDSMSFVFKDDAGNQTVIEAWNFSIDSESDLPRAEIHVPEEMQVITRDFTISGVVYDDDGESSIFYKIDDGEYKQVSTKEVYKANNPAAEYALNTSFSIDVPLQTMTDNEHTVSVYAVDINGVKGLEVSKTFRISLEEPKGAVEKPSIDTSVRQIVTISGWASDKNGIKNVQVSLDNGITYNDAEGTENWKYVVDTRAIPGGTQVVFLKITDNYGIQGLYSSLINIDNNAPDIKLELPLDDSVTSGELFFSGYTYDNVEVTDLYVTIRNLGRTGVDVVKNIKIDRIIGETIDIKDLADGFYNVELTGKDKAGNVTNVSRNIHLEKNRDPATVDILYPLNGEHKNGRFTIYGQASAEYEINSLKLYVDGKFVDETYLSDCGFFKFDMGPENMEEGTHTYRVDTLLSNGKEIPSREQTITYSSTGPWIVIDNFTYGDFAINRPYIRGQAGYSISEDELLLSKTKEVSAEFKATVAAKKVEKIELSFDNGKTFQLLSNNEKWMYRIENEDIPEGYHFFLIKATMKNGETAITRTIIQIDNTSPTVKLIAPSIGGRYNQSLKVSGLSNDDVKLEDVTVTLRKGDKSSYEIPSFIQGLYFDFKLWGASLYSVGAGLTFFDDVVKVQFSYGQFTQAQRDSVSSMFGVDLTKLRYGGDIISLKILANIAEIPFSYFFGHDLDWLYADFAVGCDFSRFSETNSGKPQILSSLIAQMEFPKIKLENVNMFSSFALYVEGALWFIPTDVSSTVDIKNLIPQIGVGIRTNIF